MNQSRIKTEMKDRICLFTLNEPDKLNAMSDDMAEEFKERITELKSDPQPKVLILTGEGRAFSAGGNLKRMLERTACNVTEVRKYIIEFYKSFLSIVDLPIPTIAAINGHAIGAGACLALACDMRLAADNAMMGFTFAKIGLHPGLGAEYFLTRTVGRARTFELLMTGDILTAEEAQRIGLVNHVVPPNQLMDKAMDLAKKIEAMPVFPIRMLKESIDAATRGTLSDTIHRQAAYQAISYLSADTKEGILSMLEKRTTRFRDEY